jgi:hypothetical protein
MRLSIGQFVTRYRVSKRHQERARMIDRFVRERFASDLADHLGPSLSRQPAIVRIRRLAIQLAIPAAGLTEQTLSRAWTLEFGRALFHTLAYPSGAGPVDVYRAPSLAAFIAAAIESLTAGTTSEHWEFAEFAPFFRQGRGEGTLALLMEWPTRTLPVLIELSRSATLDRVLGGLNAFAHERLLSGLDAESGYQPVSARHLVAAARLALRWPPQNASELRARAYAIRLFVNAAIDGRPALPARSLFHCLATIHCLLSIDGWRDVHRQLRQYAPTLPGAVAEILERLAPEAVSSRGQTVLDSLVRAVEDIRVAVQAPPPAILAAGARWITSDWCGLFYLTGTLSCLNWTAGWKRLPEFQIGGIYPLLAGVLLSVTAQFEEAPGSLDPALALLAGYKESPDTAHLRHTFSGHSAEVRARMLEAAGVTGDASTWATTFESLASVLCSKFASLIRGFRKANREAIVRGFLAQPGRIRVDKHAIAVHPHPHPYQVALHISTVDSPVEYVSWLGGRRVEFHLEGF